MELTQEEVRKYFRLFDKTNNGKLDRQEAEALIENIVRKRNIEYLSEATVNKFFDDLDQDRDGFISEDEFVSYFFNAATLDSINEPELRSFFRLQDKNNDGSLDILEIIELIKNIYKKRNIKRAPIEAVENFIKNYDVNLDGQVSEDEFVKVFLKLNK
jgi:Ca2+-binding EF-hand superfamily protein